jgi:glycosyltransferase involved in cell wall biosynthesis
MQKDLISIIMPVKNTGKYLRETIDSIINQNEKNWELIAINDHSSDDSLEILNSYENSDKRIQVFSNSGNGIIDALKMAYSKAIGEFITRMDSDDIMSKNKLEILKRNLKQYGPNHIATGLVQYFSEKGIGEGFQRYEKWMNDLTREGRNFEDIYKECVIPSPCWMLFREDLEKVKAFRPNVYPEDYDLTFRFYGAGLKVVPCNEILHLWRDYPNRTSRTDAHYQDHAFIDIKLDYFLKLDRDKSRDLILWGAGDKGKRTAKILIEKEIDFVWICDNPKKIGKDIYDKKMIGWQEIEKYPNAQSIISVASPLGQNEIRKYFESKSKKSQQDFFFFC